MPTATFSSASASTHQVHGKCHKAGSTRAKHLRRRESRELWEETGVTADKVDLIAQTSDWLTYDLPPELLGKVWKGKYRGQKQKWLLLRFNGNDADIRIDTDHPEFARWKWVKGSELVAGIVPFKRHIYEAVVAEFKDHLS